MTGRKTVTSSAIAVYDMHQVYNRIFQIGRTQTCHDRTDDTAASFPGGKTELSGKDIGIPSLEKAKVQLYEFSTKEFSMTPTELTSKYRQVPLEELVKMLVAFL